MSSMTLQNFKQKQDDLYNFRCPYCGDSAKKKSKARGFIYRKVNDYFYRCFNCETSTTFYKFLDYINPGLAKEYSLERFSNGEDTTQNFPKPKFNIERPKFKEFKIPTIKDLDDTHSAKQYILNRKIPKSFHKELYFAENFESFIRQIKPDYDKRLINEPRIIIPFRNSDGKVIALQGRALNNELIRYITVKLDEDAPKLFGLDRINFSQRIYVLEG